MYVIIPMKFRKETKSDVSINLTPLIDVVFLLLIFFMVSTTFRKNTQLSVQLPHASTQSSETEQDIIRISIDSSGKYELEDTVYNQDELPLLSEVLQTKYADNAPIMIMGDKLAPHQALVSLLELASKLNFTQIRILAQYEESRM